MLFDFIKNHYELIISCFLLLISVLINIFKKKPVSTLVESIYTFAVKAVNLCEASNIVGSNQKLAFAIRLVKTFLEEAYPGINAGSYDGLIAKTIEDILSTPQKK